MANNQTLARIVENIVKKILAQPCQYSVFYGDGSVKNGWLLSSQTLEQLPKFGGLLSVYEDQRPDEEGWMCPSSSSVYIRYNTGRVVTDIIIRQSHYEVVGDSDPIEVEVSQRIKEAWES